MNCISDTEKFARRMFRICLVLAAGMALITLYWWILWDRIWLSPVDSIEEALYGRNVTGILAQLWLLPGISPAKLVSQTSADSFLWVTLALVSWTRFWLKITQGRERKGRPDSTRSYSRVAFFTTAFLTVFDGIGLDTAAALLPIFLILLPLELIWRRFSCTYEPNPLLTHGTRFTRVFFSDRNRKKPCVIVSIL